VRQRDLTVAGFCVPGNDFFKKMQVILKFVEDLQHLIASFVCALSARCEPMGSHGEKPNASDGSPQPQAAPRVSRSFPRSNPLSL
jgi:hypothetical protein